jgi:nicotinate-nucleotide adenylyltransferase
MPVGAPPHRAPSVAPAELRLRMLHAAVAGEPRLAVDDRETRRCGPSYTIDTLLELRAEVGERPLCLVLGADAFLGLASWRRWRELFSLAHFIVMRRPGWTLEPEGELAPLFRKRLVDDPAALRRAGGGTILVQPVTLLDISSSAIRALLRGGGDPRFLVPDPVRDLLRRSACYGGAAAMAAGSMEV